MIKEAEEIHKLMKQNDLDNGKVFSLVNYQEIKDRHQEYVENQQREKEKAEQLAKEHEEEQRLAREEYIKSKRNNQGRYTKHPEALTEIFLPDDLKENTQGGK